ncbi:unnamed protein product, partial [Polarella glacialis]
SARAERAKEHYEAGDGLPSRARMIDEKLLWNPCRRLTEQMINSMPFKAFMGVLVAFNCVLLVLEADAGAQCNSAAEGECENETIAILNAALLVVYTVELALRGFAERIKLFYSVWNWLDIIIVAFGL